jgi:hypothetical protein
MTVPAYGKGLLAFMLACVCVWIGNFKRRARLALLFPYNLAHVPGRSRLASPRTLLLTPRLLV